MKPTLLCLSLIMTCLTMTAADTRVYEMRTYYAAPGKLDDLNARFRNHTCKLFAKHGMENLGYWMPQDNTNSALIYVLAYPSRTARDASWKAFMADPEWQSAQKASEKNGRLVAKVETRFMTATDYSPEIKPSIVSPDRVFELRTYTSSKGNLAALDSRFRDHTVALFKKHGMENLFYWHLASNHKESDRTLVYLLAHKSKAAAQASFDAFRKDPDWLAAREASEKKAGGSLTEGGMAGVKSVFLNPTDYSQTK